MNQYPTTETYPKTNQIGERMIQTVKCWYCDKIVTLSAHRLDPHLDNEADRACEGGNRYYWHMFGERMKEER